MRAGCSWLSAGVALGLLACATPRAADPEPPNHAERRSPVVVAPPSPASTAAPVASGVPDAAAPAPPDVESEIRWARENHADDLKAVHFGSLASRLEEWAPEQGEIEAYLSTDLGTCKKILLSRPVPPPPEPKSSSVRIIETEPDPESAHRLVGKIELKETGKGKARRRSYRLAYFGYSFERTEDGDIEVLEGGHWVPAPGPRGSTGDPPKYQGTLSYVDSEVAVYGGVPVLASTVCAGPMRDLPCTAGGTRRCDACERSRIEIVENDPTVRLLGSSPTHGARPAVPGECREPCPKLEPPDAKRVSALFARTLEWTVAERDGPAPALYKSRKRCLADRGKPQPTLPSASE